jgi:hypothetical protein
MTIFYCNTMVKYKNSASISGYYKGKLIVTRKMDKDHDLEYWKSLAHNFLEEGLRKGHSIEFMKRFNINFIKMVRYKDTIKKPKSEDWDTIMIAILILIKLNVIEEDGQTEGLLICGRKK